MPNWYDLGWDAKNAQVSDPTAIAILNGTIDFRISGVNKIYVNQSFYWEEAGLYAVDPVNGLNVVRITPNGIEVGLNGVNGLFSSTLTGNGLIVQKTDGSTTLTNQIIINSSVGIKIQNNTGTYAAPTWVDKFYVDLNGVLNLVDIIASGSIVGGTIDGVTITGSTISAKASFNVSSNIWESGGAMDYGINFGGVVTGYDAPCSMRYFQGQFGTDTALNILLPTNAQVYINQNLQVGGGVVIGNILSVGGSVNVTGSIFADYVKGYTNADKVFIGSGNSHFENTSNGVMRLKAGSGAYLMISGESLYFVKSGGASTTLVA